MRGLVRIATIAMLSGLWGASSAHAVTVLVRGSDVPVRGYLVSEDARGVTLNVPSDDGSLHERFIPAETIEILQKPVSPERLARLSPDRPMEYREYAEELADKRIDPEARDTSLRLYLIAAWLDPDTLGKSSLLGMTALARNDHEERAFRALAYLLDRDHDRSILRRRQGGASGDASGSEPANITLDNLVLRALEELRKGRYVEAARLLRRPNVEQRLARLDPAAWPELLKLASEMPRQSPPPQSDVVGRILRLELQLLGADPRADVPEEGANDPQRWSQLDTTDLARPASRLSLETITEFNPAECIFRDNRWTTVR